MATVLYLKASPRKESCSAAVAEAFLAAYCRAHPADNVDALALFATDLPAFEAPAAAAKYAVMAGQEPAGDAERAWARVIETIRRFQAADKYVFAVPMWNFSIPYRLKHYLDLILQPGLTFRFSPEAGYEGLLAGRPALAIYARGGAYGPGSGAEALDRQKPYLEQALGFIGLTDVRGILVEPTLHDGPEGAARAVEKAQAEAAALAVDF